jgi:hypothetical protein
MKFRFSYDVILPFGQYESSLNLVDSFVGRVFGKPDGFSLLGAIL